MRPLDFLRWRLLDLLNWIWKPEKPLDYVHVRLPEIKKPEVLNLPNGVWRRRFFIEERPDLYNPPQPAFRRPTVRLEPLPGEIWLNSLPTTDPINRLDTQPGIVEETQKYQSLPKEALPKFLRE